MEDAMPFGNFSLIIHSQEKHHEPVLLTFRRATKPRAMESQNRMKLMENRCDFRHTMIMHLDIN